ncbi:hypothetical protein GGI05_001815 [Coemansia sp. RSA 2603]|nr:hypothetical protein GGI05_001815 [Coemansia sp. RSA 2603]
MLDYLEAEPYASAEKYFIPFMSRMMVDGLDHLADPELLKRLLSVALNRIELGEYVDIYPWQCLEHILLVTQKCNFWELVDAEFQNRRHWWSKVFFSNANVLSRELEEDNIAVRERCRELLKIDTYEHHNLFDSEDSTEESYRSEDEEDDDLESDEPADTDTESDTSLSDHPEMKAKLEP